MRIAFHYHPSNMHRPINPGELWSSSRGLTGSEGSCLHYALGLAGRGHETFWFTNTVAPGDVDGLKIRPYSEWSETKDRQWDACVAWMNAAPLMAANPGVFRVLGMQCSDFGGQPGDWERFADRTLVLSRYHAEELKRLSPYPASKYALAYNGVAVDEFRPGTKRPGSCLWASSHDRGLHSLLEMWPEIRRRVPHATLRICYDITGMHSFARRNDSHPLLQELSRRSTYSLEMLKRLEPHGVTLLGSISRRDIAREMAQSEALLYPLNPARFCETFGSTVLESMASGCVPVLVAADAFGELWSEAAPSVAPPFEANRSAYLELATEILTDSKSRERYRSACIGHAHRFAWDTLVERFERFLETRGAEGLEVIR